MKIETMVTFLIFTLLICPNLSWANNQDTELVLITKGTTENSRYPSNLSAQEYFIRNEGQWEESILYLAKTNFGHVGLCNDGMIYHLVENIEPEQDAVGLTNIGLTNDSCVFEEMTMKVLFHDPHGFSVEERGISDHYYNFIYGDYSQHFSNIKGYKEIIYKDVWKGVNINFSVSNNGFKYNIIKNPLGRTSDIRFEIKGAEDIQIVDNDIVYKTQLGLPIFESIPYSFDLDLNEEIKCDYLLSDNLVSFSIVDENIGNSYLIDPLVYSTFIGGVGYDSGHAIDIDDKDNAYITGFTRSYNFPTTPGVVSTNGQGEDAFIAKVKSLGQSLVFSTYIGGSESDRGYDIILDDTGDIIIAGTTTSSDFPTTSNAFDTTFNSNWPITDNFILRLNNKGTKVISSTYIGGSNTEYEPSIDMDNIGNIYMTSATASIDFPVTNGSYDQIYNGGGSDLYIVQLNGNLSKLKYSTFIGGSDTETSRDIKWSPMSYISICGSLTSTDFPVTSNAYNEDKNSKPMNLDCFLLKLNISDSNLSFSTYFGGTGNQGCKSMDIDNYGKYYITGSVSKGDFPITENAYDKTLNGGRDIFITKFLANGTDIEYSTFFGGNDSEIGISLVLDENNNIYVTGRTTSKDFPIVKGSYCTSNNGRKDGIVFRFNLTKNNLIYSTYIGGRDYDVGGDIKINRLNETFIVGTTKSADFPVTSEAYNTNMSGDYDVFVFHLNLRLKPSPPINLTG